MIFNDFHLSVNDFLVHVVKIASRASQEVCVVKIASEHGWQFLPLTTNISGLAGTLPPDGPQMAAGWPPDGPRMAAGCSADGWHLSGALLGRLGGRRQRKTSKNPFKQAGLGKCVDRAKLERTAQTTARRYYAKVNPRWASPPRLSPRAHGTEGDGGGGGRRRSDGPPREDSGPIVRRHDCKLPRPSEARRWGGSPHLSS